MVEGEEFLDVSGSLRSLLQKIQREKGGNPRVHPNGFIQLDLTATDKSWDQSKKRGHSGAAVRLHVWNPPGIELPHQGTINEIHDHVFDMSSTVIKGRLTQRLYEFVIGSMFPLVTEDGEPPRVEHFYELYRAVYDKQSSSRLEATGITGSLRQVQVFDIEAGHGKASNYTQPAFTLHDSDAHDQTVVTIMEKTKVRVGDATVICAIGQPPDNEYDRAEAMDPDDIWTAIWASLEV